MHKFGLRYERLLILSGPLSLLALTVYFVALASATSEDQELINCYVSASTAFEKNKSRIEFE